MNFVTRSLLLSFVIGAFSSSAASARYGSGVNPLGPVVAMNDATLDQQIVGLSNQLKVTSIDRVGKTQAALWKEGAASPSGISRTERIAILAHLQRAGSQGAESDFLIAQPDGSKVPTTVIWELSGALTVQTGAPVKDLLKPGATAEELASKYKLDPFTEAGASWTPLELATIEKALSLLGPEEVALLGGLGFRRKVADPGARSAYYRRADDGMTIDVFSKVFSTDQEYFFGSVDAPIAASVSTIIHEMAHAMSDFQGRQKAVAANKAAAEFTAAQEKSKADPSPENKKATKEKFEAAKALRSAINALDKVMLAKGRASERSFAAVVDPKTSVTQYGRTTIDENLAEGFVLSKLDTAALERVARPGLEWCKAGTFATEAQKPLE